MTTVFTHRLLSGFGNITSPDVDSWAEFSILWDGGIASLPGWDQTNASSGSHFPGGNRNVVFLMGHGALTRSFSVLCESRAVFATLAGLQQYSGTLRVPAAMNELDIATEVDFAGDVVADIPNVVLTDLTGIQVGVDGTVSAIAGFWARWTHMSAGIVFADIDEAFAATALPVAFYVRIGGVPIDATEASVQFGAEQPVGTCTVYVEAPRPPSAEINATIEIEMGYAGASRRRFLGFIPNDESVTDAGGRMVRIEGVGWASRLTYPEYAGIEIAGPVSLKDAFRSLCRLRSIPTYLSDDTTAVDGVTVIRIGGNDLVDGGNIRIDNETEPLTWLQRVPPAYGYRAFDSPDGTVRLARVSGLASPTFTGSTFTTDLATGDYVVPRAPLTLNVRSGPGTSYAVIDTVGVDDLGRVLADDVTSANGFLWMRFVFEGHDTSGYVAIHNFAGDPTFEKQTPDVQPPLYVEGVNCFDLSRTRDVRDMATYIEVIGARYTADDGGTIEIRNIPDVVPYAVELDPPGYRKATISLQDIVTDQQAAWVRNATEVDRAAPAEVISWSSPGRPDLQPGDVVTICGPTTHGIDMRDYWLMNITEAIDGSGYIGRYTGWRGAGTALRAGNDCRTETVPGDSVIHAGTQTMSNYRDPSPDSVRDPYDDEPDKSKRRWVVPINITVTDDDYSSLRLTGIGHGTNSIKNHTAITGSQIEIWQLEDPSQPESGDNEFKSRGTLELPTLDEELNKRRNYAANNRYWTKFSLPMPGQLKVGPANLIVVSGKEEDEVDDFELAELKLIYCGVGEPELPGSIGT